MVACLNPKMFLSLSDMDPLDAKKTDSPTRFNLVNYIIQSTHRCFEDLSAEHGPGFPFFSQ